MAIRIYGVTIQVVARKEEEEGLARNGWANQREANNPNLVGCFKPLLNGEVSIRRALV